MLCMRTGIVDRRARCRCDLRSDAADPAVGVGVRGDLDRRNGPDARGVRPRAGRLRLRPRWALQQAQQGGEEGAPHLTLPHLTSTQLFPLELSNFCLSSTFTQISSETKFDLALETKLKLYVGSIKLLPAPTFLVVNYLGSV